MDKRKVQKSNRTLKEAANEMLNKHMLELKKQLVCIWLVTDARHHQAADARRAGLRGVRDAASPGALLPAALRRALGAAADRRLRAALHGPEPAQDRRESASRGAGRQKGCHRRRRHNKNT
ncbi:unnamed protein product [Phaeothamnion confervicola]